MVKSKKFKFSVLVDEFGKEKKHLKKLIRLLGEEYPFLKQASRCLVAKRIQNAKKGEVIVFGLSRKYDFKVVSYEEWENLVDRRRFKLVELCCEWNKVKCYLDQYAEENYPNENGDEYTQRHYCETYIFDDFDLSDVYVVQSSPKKKNKYVRTTTSKKRNSLHLEEVKVHHNFVRVGWDVYDILLNRDDDEYVKIDGNTYWVDRDSSGKGKLSVK